MAMPNPKDTITEEMIKGIKESLDKSISEKATEWYSQAVWIPEEEKRKYSREKWQRELYQDWDKVASSAADPVRRLRKEMHDELGDIKSAIRKLGIMLDGDKPTEEQLKNSKMLKEAYLKYKMVEGLVLGGKK